MTESLGFYTRLYGKAQSVCEYLISIVDEWWLINIHAKIQIDLAEYYYLQMLGKLSGMGGDGDEEESKGQFETFLIKYSNDPSILFSTYSALINWRWRQGIGGNGNDGGRLQF